MNQTRKQQVSGVGCGWGLLTLSLLTVGVLLVSVLQIVAVRLAFYNLLQLNLPYAFINPVLDLLQNRVAWVGWPLVFTNVLWLGYAVSRWWDDGRQADAPLPPVDEEQPPRLVVGEASDQVQEGRLPE